MQVLLLYHLHQAHHDLVVSEFAVTQHCAAGLDGLCNQETINLCTLPCTSVFLVHLKHGIKDLSVNLLASAFCVSCATSLTYDLIWCITCQSKACGFGVDLHGSSESLLGSICHAVLEIQKHSCMKHFFYILMYTVLKGSYAKLCFLFRGLQADCS